jgi:hypothetical protein
MVSVMESNVNVVRFLGTFLPVLPRFLSFTHAYIIITIGWLRCWAHTNTKLSQTFATKNNK